jgi:choline-sulfatase
LRRVLPLLICFAIAAVPGSLLASDSLERFRPNILLITVDTFRPDHIGYYGYPKETSPYLDQFSREGAFFKQAFSSSGWTTPGLISVLTGLYAPTHGVDIRGKTLDGQIETLPELLRKEGYRAPDIFFLSDLPNFSNLGLEPYSDRDRYLPDGDEIIFKWLEQEAESGPFFLYYHYRDLHLPYAPGTPFEEMFLPEAFDSPLGIWGRIRWFLAREKIDLVKKNVMILRGDLDFSALDRPWLEALYDGQIRRLDQLFFKRLRETLEALSLDRSTLLIVSADHGEELVDHGLVGHVSTYREGRLYDEVTRIPLIIWFPGVIANGVVIEDLVQNIDIVPTILDLLDLQQPAALPGQSLMPLIDGSGGWRPRPVFLETSGGGYTANAEQYKRRYRAVRTERWKLLHSVAEEEFALYDLASDPHEMEDVGSDFPAVTDSLRTQLHQWSIAFGSQRVADPKTPHAGEGKGPMRGEPSLRETEGPPQILFPTTGDSLYYRGEEYTIQLRWTGESRAAYTIEYVVGYAAYHLEGELEVTSSSPGYGPYQESFWNSLALYNPFKFRVYRQDRPDAKSAWVTFHLVPTIAGPAAVSVWITLSLFLSSVPGFMTQFASACIDLVAGLGKGFLDLLLWLGTVPVADIAANALLLAIAAALLAPAFARMGKEKSRAWLAVVCYVAFVFATIPLLPRVWEVLNHYTEGAVRHLGIAAVGMAVLAAVLGSWRSLRRHPWSSGSMLLFVVAVYAYLLNRFSVYPAERLHLVEYGFVSFLLFRALVLHMSHTRAYIASFLLTAIVGFSDESIQWVLPDRYFELKDVKLNIVSGGLGLLLVRFVLRPSNLAQARRADG